MIMRIKKLVRREQGTHSTTLQAVENEIDIPTRCSEACMACSDDGRLDLTDLLT